MSSKLVRLPSSVGMELVSLVLKRYLCMYVFNDRHDVYYVSEVRTNEKEA